MKKYDVSYRIELDNSSFINYEVIDANDEHEAFYKARNKGEKRFRYESRVMCLYPFDHVDSSVTEITDKQIEDQWTSLMLDDSI